MAELRRTESLSSSCSKEVNLCAERLLPICHVLAQAFSPKPVLGLSEDASVCDPLHAYIHRLSAICCLPHPAFLPFTTLECNGHFFLYIAQSREGLKILACAMAPSYQLQPCKL